MKIQFKLLTELIDEFLKLKDGIKGVHVTSKFCRFAYNIVIHFLTYSRDQFHMEIGRQEVCNLVQVLMNGISHDIIKFSQGNIQQIISSTQHVVLSLPSHVRADFFEKLYLKFEHVDRHIIHTKVKVQPLATVLFICVIDCFLSFPGLQRR